MTLHQHVHGNSIATNSSNRPVTKFKICPTIPDPANYSFQWTPPSFLTSDTSQNTSAIPMVTTQYTVVVTDLNGGCTDTATTVINVLCDTCDKPIPTIDGLTCYGGNDASITGYLEVLMALRGLYNYLMELVSIFLPLIVMSLLDFSLTAFLQVITRKISRYYRLLCRYSNYYSRWNSHCVINE